MIKPIQANIHAIDSGQTELTTASVVSASPAASQDEYIDLWQYVVALGKRWPMILGITLLASLLATLVAYSIVPVYRSTAVLLIEADQRNAVSIEQVIGVDTSKQEYYLTQFELLKSRTIAEKVIARYDLESLSEFNGEREPSWLDKAKNPIGTLRGIAHDSPLLQSWLPPKSAPSPERVLEGRKQKVISAFKERLSVSPVRNTQLVKISFESEDRVLAATLANAVGEAYIENNRESRLLASQDATTWLEDRLAQLKAAVTGSEQRLTAFLEQEGLLDVEGIDSLASTELSDLSRRLSDARDRRVAAESLYFVLQDNRNAGLAELSSIPAISNHPQLRDVRLAEIEAERLVSELSKRYGPKHDRMIQAQAQLGSVKQRASSVLGELAAGIEKELRSARRQENALQTELDGKKSQFQGIAVKRATYDALKRDVDSNRKLYDLFLNRQKETAATNDFQAAVARFSDRASAPLLPAKPRKSLIVLVTALVSMVIAASLALLLESLQNTIESSSDIQDKFGLLPLGSIPKITGRKYRNKQIDTTLFFDEKQRAFSESIRSIRTSLLLNMEDQGSKRICITSSVPGEGKSTTAINLAMAMAGMERVLLVEADLRKPNLSERFGLKRTYPGLSNHLVMGADIDDCIYHHEKSGLDVICAGMLTPNPQELLGSEKFAQLLKQWEQHYDKIVIDSPPLLAVSDGLILSRLAGSALLVISAGSTNVKQLNSSLLSLIKHDVSVIGVALNKVDAKRSAEYGGYGGYYGYN